MERVMGEVFELEGEKYRVEEKEGCDNCGFDNKRCYDSDEIVGDCSFKHRKDGKNVIFVRIVD